MDLHFFIPIARAAEEAASESANQGVAATLGINWLLLAGQMVNFAIVLFILWKFVFNPVGKKLQERSEKIGKSLADAEDIEKQKQEFAVWKEKEIAEARQEASAIMTAAQAGAQKAKDQILQQTKEEQQKLIEQSKRQMEAEKNQQLAGAKAELADIVTQAAEKILRSKLDKQKDSDLIRESIKQIK